MGSNLEVEQFLPRPRRTDDGSKRTCELTSSIVLSVVRDFETGGILI